MTTTFDEPRSTASPSVKLRTIGAFVEFRLVDVEEVPVFDQKTGLQKKSAKGWLHVQKRLTGLVTKIGDGAKAGTQEEPVEIEIGDVYAIYSRVGGYFDWKEKLEAFKAEHGRSVAVGDKIRWTLDEIKKPTEPGYSGLKVTSFAMRPATADEGETVAMCEALHAERHAAAPTELDATEDAWDSDSDPF